MPFLDTRFPEAVSFSVTGGPEFFTEITVVHSGYEFRNRARAQSLGVWDVSHNARQPHQYEPLIAFFHAAGGRANTFRYYDWLDHSADATTGRFTLLTATTFQLTKRYTFGSYTHDRFIYLPVNPVIVTGGTVTGINYATGVVTVSAGTPTSWVGDFDVHARFDIDRMQMESFNRTGGRLLINWQSIPIVGVPIS